MKRGILQRWTAVLGVLLVVACGDAGESPADALPTVVGNAALEAAVLPTATRDEPRPETAVSNVPTLTPPPVNAAPAQAADVVAQEAALRAVVVQTLQAESGSTAALGGFEELVIRPLANGDWLVHSAGLRPFDPPQNHFVAAYRPSGAGWQSLGRVDLELPDILFDESVTEVAGGENGRSWLEVVGGVGPHGGCLNVLRLDNAGLTGDLAHCHSSPMPSGMLQDLNGDGALDVILNNTNDYVFCYACSVRLPQFEVKTWNGRAWQTVSLSDVAADGTAVATANNEAVRLARAGLWQEAAATISTVNSDSPTIIWNQTLIDLYEQAHLEAVGYGVFPFLQNLFYGDYAAAMAILKVYTPAEVFQVNQNALLEETPAEGYTDALSEWVVQTAARAIEAEPELAAAYFLRGWGTYLTNPTDPSVIPDLQRAIELAPRDLYYQESLQFVRGS